MSFVFRGTKTMHVLITGSAGFIGYHVSNKLLDLGHQVFGIDNLNSYYDVNLKKDRLIHLKKSKNSNHFHFKKGDISDEEVLKEIFKKNQIDVVVHLAAQAGVRYSLINPHAYIQSNLVGFTNILECCRHHKIKHFIYASSSSVYGSNKKLPFHEDDNVDHPISLYAATKKSNELIAHSYSHLFRLPCSGLRFFTVYGPWGRPDMAMSIFADAIAKEKPFQLFHDGEMLRDFTYVDDIVEAIARLCEHPAKESDLWNAFDPKPSISSAPYRIYNIGNNNPVLVKAIIEKMEKFFGKKALIQNLPIQPGDVLATYADTTKLFEAVHFQPKTSLDDGLNAFLNWYVEYKK